ncbi:hypothetical protein HMPREF3223_00615 [Cutibacterium avidum]|nr:hypothetical protein HMPREF3223_00615 [Cutibacterium avidum]
MRHSSSVATIYTHADFGDRHGRGALVWVLLVRDGHHDPRRSGFPALAQRGRWVLSQTVGVDPAVVVLTRCRTWCGHVRRPRTALPAIHWVSRHQFH